MSTSDDEISDVPVAVSAGAIPAGSTMQSPPIGKLSRQTRSPRERNGGSASR